MILSRSSRSRASSAIARWPRCIGSNVPPRMPIRCVSFNGDCPSVNCPHYTVSRRISTMPKVNHEIMKWARETAGLSRDEAVRKLAIRDARGVRAVERLAALESGAVEPTRPTLVKMAKQYRRPLLTFYLSGPPKIADRTAYYRTLPAHVSKADQSIMDALIRSVRVSQSIVRATLEDDDESERLPFVGAANVGDGEHAIKQRLGEFLAVTAERFQAQPGPGAAFNLLRADVERLGVFVLLKGDLGSHHTALDTETFRGFAIADDLAPFIVINDKDAIPAWSFTLLHEFVHLLLGQSGLSDGSEDDHVERLCDDVASGFLLPAEQLALLELGHSRTDDAISDFAAHRNLSRSMVAYRAYRAGMISRATYASLSTGFRQQWLKQPRPASRTKSPK